MVVCILTATKYIILLYFILLYVDLAKKINIKKFFYITVNFNNVKSFVKSLSDDPQSHCSGLDEGNSR